MFVGKIRFRADILECLLQEAESQVVSCEKLGVLIKSMKLAILEMHLQSKAEEKYPQKVEVGQMSDNLTLFS